MLESPQPTFNLLEQITTVTTMDDIPYDRDDVKYLGSWCCIMGQGDPYLVSHLALKISVAKFYDERFLLWRERHIMHKLGVARMLERCPAGTPNADASALTQGSAAHCALVQNLQLNTSVHVVLNRARTEPSSSNTLSMEATLSGSNKALELSQQKSHTYGFLMCTKKWTSPKLYYNLLSAKGTDPQRAEIMRGMQE